VRKLLLLALSAVAVVGLVGSASAATRTIVWTGQGGDNLPCADGGHWVLTGKGITYATISFGGSDLPMYHNANGSWAFDSVGPISAGMIGTVSTTFERTLTTGNPQFVLSHCNAGDGGYGGGY
jgi:hypothetical protein